MYNLLCGSCNYIREYNKNKEEDTIFKKKKLLDKSIKKVINLNELVRHK